MDTNLFLSHVVIAFVRIKWFSDSIFLEHLCLNCAQMAVHVDFVTLAFVKWLSEPTSGPPIHSSTSNPYYQYIVNAHIQGL